MSDAVMIMAGGTGGHVFPGLAVAEILKNMGYEVIWLGGVKGIEQTLVPKHEIKLVTLAVSGLRGKGIKGWLVMPFKLSKAVWQAIGIIREAQPVCVLSMGGYAAAPGGIAAWILRKPVFIHEQNRIPGLTNRLLSLFAKKIYTGFQGVFQNKNRVLALGNPVRQNLQLSDSLEERIKAEGPWRLLILGGSLGAQSLNTQIPAVLSEFKGQIQVVHQCGAMKMEETQKAYAQHNIKVDIQPFISDMKQAYLNADLMICRAGALTIAEISNVGLASILVPYPYAVDDHQTANASYLEAAGAAKIIQENDDFKTEMKTCLAEILNRESLLNMAEAARQMAMRNAADLLVKDMLLECQP